MIMILRYSILIFFILTNSVYAFQEDLANLHSTDKSPYQEGLERIETGDIETALDYWYLLSRNNQDPAIIDPRIGITYLETVTEHEMFDYYEKANDTYFWSIQTNQLQKHNEFLEKELERLRPLFERKEYRELRRALNNNDSQSFENKLKGFWILNDPTPDSKYNERLLEHWERIAYVKDNFTRAKNTIYNTDERAITFIKYGPPDHIDSGVISFQFNAIAGFIREIEDFRSARNDNVAERAASNQIDVQTDVNDIAQNVISHFPNPDYEIWHYYGIDANNADDKLMFIFGQDGNSRQFGLRKSLEEFLPNSTFRTQTFRNESAIPPSIYLQLFMYDRMSIVDKYFDEAYMDLQRNIFSLNYNLTKRSSTLFKTKNESKLASLNYTDIEHESSIIDEMADLGVNYHHYLFYDTKKEVPYYKTVIHAKPKDQIAYYLMNPEYDYPAKSIDLFFEVNSYDRQWNETFRNSTFYHFNSENLFNLPDKVVAYLDHYPDPGAGPTVINSKLENTNPEVMRVGPLQREIFAINKQVAELEPVESNDFSDFSVSDLILGYSLENMSLNYNTIGFGYEPDYNFPFGSNLVINFEVYNLAKAGNMYPFTIEYDIASKNGLLNSLIGNSSTDQASNIIEFVSGEPHFSEILELELPQLEPGKYELYLKFSETETGKTIEKNLEFSIGQ